ncbi:ran-binding protein 3 [Bombyx mori]|uniref:ran-binding protein 3 n=1 Tax=Bombyx mori TaxID=7091 RepID=UPI002ED647E5
MKKSTMEDAKQEKTPGDMCNGTSQTRMVLAKPRLGGFGSPSFSSTSNKTNNPFGSVLRPPQLKATTNPFLKPNPIEESGKEKDKEASENRLNESKENIEVPQFVPLGGANVASRNVNAVPATNSPAAPSFVFGQNLSERVVIKENGNNGEASATEHSSSNGTTELLFTNAAASVKENNQESESSRAETSNRDALVAAAAEYERSHARPLPPTTNCTITGEEDETNVLQISCRLFAWEAGSWRERGRGVLRLNECGGGGAGAAGGGGARLVVRVAGSLRVVLNTKLWPDMLADQAGPKSLRITALDAQQQIKLFLIMGSPADIVQLTRAIKARVQTSKKPAGGARGHIAPSQSAAARLDADADDCGDRLAAAPGAPEYQSNVDGMRDDNETKPLKRKEPVDDETSPKRQCPEIVID